MSRSSCWEKGSEVGAHILSGAVIDPVALDRLLPDWREDESCPVKVKVKKDRFRLLGPAGAIPLPNFMMPPLMNNHGNYIISLGNLCRWMAEKAEAMGVEIYPGFAAAEVLYDENGAVRGVATGDMGVGKDGKPKATFERGMELLGKYTLIGEGVRGSLAKQLIAKYDLDKDADVPKFGIGIKEIWDIDPAKHEEGIVEHSFGWPLDEKTGGGSFLYHMENNQVAVGFVVYLNYKNPYLSPFEEFQRFKLHPTVKELFEGGTRVSYGARCIAEGGYQSVPKLTFPGGALIGCSAGFVNVPRIKGIHNAMDSGLQVAEPLIAALAEGRNNDELSAYEEGVAQGPDWQGPLQGAQRQAALGEIRPDHRCDAGRHRHVVQFASGLLAFRYAEAWQERCQEHPARLTSASRSPIPSPMARSHLIASARSTCQAPTTRKTSPAIWWFRTRRCRNPPNSRSLAACRRGSARPCCV